MYGKVSGGAVSRGEDTRWSVNPQMLEISHARN